MDDLYRGWQDPLGPELTAVLAQIITAHLAGEEITFQAWDWQTSQPGSQITIPPVDHLILEGVGSGQSSIRESVDSKIWVEIEPIVGLRRVIERDGGLVSDLDLFEEQMRRFADHAAAHFAAEGTLFAADFEVNGQGSL